MDTCDIGLPPGKNLEFTYSTCRIARVDQGKAEVISRVDGIRIGPYGILERPDRAGQVTILSEPGSELVCRSICRLPGQPYLYFPRCLADLLRPRGNNNRHSCKQQFVSDPLR